MEPAIELKIPIYIRNTFEPHLSGTRIYLPTKVCKQYFIFLNGLLLVKHRM
mgnify:CR=1 FL=1